MFSVGAGSNVNVHVPSPLSTAIGPAAGSHDHHGPVIATELAAAQTVVVIDNTVDAYSHDPSSSVASAL